MPIEMPRGLPFSVDTFTSSSRNKRHHFLTHAHKDHTAGIAVHGSFPIYSTHLTKILVSQHHPELDQSLFLEIEVGQSIVIDDPDGNFAVTAFDANHCPGSVMYLFEGNFGNILHTGDCRLTAECLQCLHEKYLSRKGKKPLCQLDFVFLDCTFGKVCQRFPSKLSAIRQVINCIWKHSNAPVVYLSCDLLGQESVLLEVSRTFGSKIFVDSSMHSEIFRTLMVIAPDVISTDPSLRFHLFEGFPKLHERASRKIVEARNNLQPKPLIIRPSAQWYACNEESKNGHVRSVKLNEAVRDEYGIWRICYSIHSSKDELECALQLLAPKWVVSTTHSCRAMELEYVSRHCFASQLSSDRSLWKLLDINVENSSGTSEQLKAVGSCPIGEGLPSSSIENQFIPLTNSSTKKELLGWSSDQTMPLTLFGRARLGFENCNMRITSEIYESCVSHRSGVGETSYVEDELSRDATCETKKESLVVQEEYAETVEGFTSEMYESCASHRSGVRGTSYVEDELSQEATCETKKELLVVPESAKTVGAFTSKVLEVDRHGSVHSFGHSENLSKSLRKLYRSMNVPVPKPLPSLMDLMKSRKRSRR